jgi:hypothetical protein
MMVEEEPAERKDELGEDVLKKAFSGFKKNATSG